jgi:hypothetical protein
MSFEAIKNLNTDSMFENLKGLRQAPAETEGGS